MQARIRDRSNDAASQLTVQGARSLAHLERRIGL